MGLYKLCEHKGRNRDRCEHPWWGSFRGVRVSLSKWANREIRSKAEAGAALDELRMAIRAGTFDPRGLAAPKAGPMTFRELAELYRDRHVIPKRLALAKDYAWSVKPFLERFGDRALADIRTADVQDFIADLRKPRAVHRRGVRVLSAARSTASSTCSATCSTGRSVASTSTSTPFKRGSETLIKKLREDNKRRRRIDEQEEAALLRAGAAAHPGDDHRRHRHRHAPGRDAGAAVRRRRSRARPDHAPRRDDEEPQDARWCRSRRRGFATSSTGCGSTPRASRSRTRRSSSATRSASRSGCSTGTWQSLVLRAHGHTPTWAPRLNYQGLSDESQDAFRRINLRWHDLRHEYASRLVEHGRAAGPGARPARPRVDHDHRALRQPDAREPADCGGEAGARVGVRTAAAAQRPAPMIDRPGRSLTAGIASAKAPASM